MIIDVLLIAVLVVMAVLAVAITIRARRDHVSAASDPDQP